MQNKPKKIFKPNNPFQKIQMTMDSEQRETFEAPPKTHPQPEVPHNPFLKSGRETFANPRNEDKQQIKKQFSHVVQPQENQIEDKIKSVIENPFAQMGMDFTKQKVNELMEKNKGYLSNLIFNQTLKHYFDVDQGFILRKILFMILPIKRFGRKQVLNEEEKMISQPELYIPTLALISYVLLVCLQQIVEGKIIQPNLIVEKIYTCLLITMINVVFFKMIFKIANGFSIPFLDCISQCGYKYLCLCIYLLVTSIPFEHSLFHYGAQGVLVFNYFVFCFRTFREIQVQYGGLTQKSNLKSVLFLSVLEILFCYWLIWICF